MLNYEVVPNNILTGKDLDYLSDIFNDEEIVNILDRACSLFDNNLNSTLNILESRGETGE